LNAGVVPTPNAQLVEKQVVVEFKKQWKILTKMPAVAGTELVDFEKLPWLLTTYDEIRTHFTKYSSAME